MVSFRSIIMLITRHFVSFITTKPGITVLVVAFLTVPMLMQAITFQDNMTADVMAYLPDPEDEDDKEHPTTLLKEVREEWTTDIILIYVETPNAYNEQDQTNITRREVLEEMSRIEGDFIYGREHNAVDWDKSDRGRNDGVVFVLSISSVIKELNSSEPRFINAVEKQFTQLAGGDEMDEDDDVVDDLGQYAIPDNQQRIDNLVDQFGDSFSSMVRDTNNDTIWDTATILIAIHHSFDQKEMIENVEKALAYRSAYPDPATGKPYTRMTLTGLVVVLHDITEKIYNDLLLMLPFSLLFVSAIMYFFHRTPKIIVIVAIPTIVTLGWTFGILVLAGIELTPMVVAAGPILIGLSVDDALHITNRVGEFHRKGLPFKECVISTFGTTGRAVFLTTVTTVTGFAALWISDIGPMRTVGTTLFIGITLAFVFTITLVPPLILLTRYEKRMIPLWKDIGKAPVKYRKGIIMVALLLTAVSVFNISVMNTDIRGDESAPEGIESLEKIKEYTVQFKAGQTNINIVRGDTTDPSRPEPVKTLDLLKVVEATEYDINEIEHCNATTIVDFFKAVRVDAEIPIPGEIAPFVPDWFPTTFTGSLWDFMNLEIWQGNADWQERAIEISYDTLSDEVRAMLINDAYTKTLIYTSMPYINLGDTEDIVDEMNDVVVEHEKALSGDGSISRTTGGAPISIAINDGIHETQWDTIYLSLIIVTVILFFALYDRRRSLGFNLLKGCITMTPIVMVVLWQPVTMIMGGSANVNIFTAMLGTIIIGIGIDFSIHMSERIAEEGEDQEGIQRAAEGTGQSLVEASFTTIMGVTAGILISWSSFAGLRNFFFIITALVFYSLLGGLLVLPAIYSTLVKMGIIKKIPDNGHARKSHCP